MFLMNYLKVFGVKKFLYQFTVPKQVTNSITLGFVDLSTSGILSM